MSAVPARAVARARANVALVKYWGKRQGEGHLPAVGSISLTLADLRATARVLEAEGEPRFRLHGEAVEGVAGERMAQFLDRVAMAAGAPARLVADLEVDFPVGAGLASSAAIYCAVAAAASSALGLRLGRSALSALARKGSGSACRSVYGGFVEWHRGARPDGADSVAEPLLGEGEWDLAVAVAIVSRASKPIGSREAMARVERTSPLYRGWLEAQAEDLDTARRAIARRDLRLLGRVAEENCLRMHATCLAARPPILFLRPATWAVVDAVQALREAGVEAYFTIDAGPQVKVLCRRREIERVASVLAAVPGVERVVATGPGPGVEMLEGEEPWRPT